MSDRERRWGDDEPGWRWSEGADDEWSSDDVVLAAGRAAGSDADADPGLPSAIDDRFDDRPDFWSDDAGFDADGDDGTDRGDDDGDGGGSGSPGPPGGRARDRTGRGARLVVLLVLAALLTGAVVLGRDREAPAPIDLNTAAADTATVPPADALTATWYCAAGTGDATGTADEFVDVGNLTTATIRATISVLPGDGDDARERTVRLEAYERARVRVGDIVSTPSPGVVVEVRGGRAVVEHEVRGATDVAMGACAREPSRTWYFAGGSTDRGTDTVLELFNPFGDDAIVDVAFVTDGGTIEPSELQGFSVDRRTKVRVPLADLVPREGLLATAVRARTGRIVAEQVRLATGTEAGIGVELGVTKPRSTWFLPFGATGAGRSNLVVLANPGSSPAEVALTVVLPGEGLLEPDEIVVPSRSVVSVDPSGRVGAFPGFAVSVRTRAGTPVVAGVVMIEGAGAVGRGVALAGGADRAAKQWALAGSPPGSSTVLTALNRSRRPVTVEVRAYTVGDPDSPRSAPAFAVPAGKSVTIDLDELGISPEQVLLVSADGPVVVGREVVAPGESVALAVPLVD